MKTRRTKQSTAKSKSKQEQLIKKPLKTTEITPKKINAKPLTKHNIPDILYTEDGTTFFPCKNCCRAFAAKSDLKKHSYHCTKSPTAAVEEVEPEMPKLEDSTRNSTEAELNNNQQEDEKTDIDEKPEISLNKLYFPKIQGCINDYDLKTKAKIVKHLNNVMGDVKIQIFALENGNLVAKLQNASGLTGTEIISSDYGNKIQIEVKNPAENDCQEGLVEILERLFGPDQLFNNLNNLSTQANSQAVTLPNPLSVGPECILIDPEIEPEIEEEEIDADETIILEDLDIHICKQCGAVYHTLEDLVAHDKFEHRKIKRKYTQSELEKYSEMFKANANVENVCPICSKKLRCKSVWSRHVQSHSEIGLFECNVCKKKFTRDDHRKNHEKRHLYAYDSD